MATLLLVWILLGMLVIIIEGQTYFETKYGSIKLKKEPSQDIVDGKFQSPAFEGGNSLNFYSKVTNDQSVLNLSNADNNKVIMSYKFKDNAIGYMQIGDFVFIENPWEKTAFHVTDMPDNLNEEVDEMLYSKIQQQPSANITKTFALSELKGKYNLKMVESLALALGEIGVLGKDFPSLLSIFIAAQALVSDCENENQEFGDHRRERREQCPNPECEGCQQKPSGSTCLGMCGPDTRCWNWVCGDCCLHQGCLQHDECCRTQGMVTMACLSVWKFKCHSYSC